MKKAKFEREMAAVMAAIAKCDRPDYWAGYQQGLFRRFHGTNFGSDADHNFRIYQDGARGDGYRIGYRGPVDWDNLPAAVRTIRAWRGWSRGQMGLRMHRSARTIEMWEQDWKGRKIPEGVVERLKKIWEFE